MQKQTFWFTIINYLGILIGVLATIFVYPYDYSFYGEIAYVDSLAQVMYPIMVFGGAQALIHFYPTLSNKYQKSLVRYTLQIVLKIFSLVSAVLLLGVSIFNWDKKIYLYYALPLALIMAIVEVLKRQAANLKKIAIPTFYEKIIPKLALPIVFGLFYWGYVTNTVAFSIFVAFYLLMVLFMLRYVLQRFPFSFSSQITPFDVIEKKEYYTYCFYSFLGSFGSFLAFRIDGLMIPEFLDFEANGAYRNAVNFATAMAIPATGLFTIYAPQVSNYIKNKDFKTLQIKYTEIAKLLFFIGAIILGCVVVGAYSFFDMLPTSNKLIPILPIIYILGLNVLFNMATGFSTEIISYSKYYKFNILAILILVLLNVMLNFLVLTQTSLGIVGVSFATLFSLVAFNVAKLIFIYKKMKVIPFDKNYGRLIILMLTVVSIIYYLPKFEVLWIEFIVKTGLIIVLSISLTYAFKLLPALNEFLAKIRKK